jgi:GNAT superfamily N-acetyltransferase
MPTPNIVSFNNAAHREQTIALWRDAFGYLTPHNEPGLVIDKKTGFDDRLFVAVDDEHVVGTVMAGYDGHRGWIYALAVLPRRRGEGIGSALLDFAERRLAELGCVKINLQIAEGNESIEAYYLGKGYATERRISMGKLVERNIPPVDAITDGMP